MAWINDYRLYAIEVHNVGMSSALQISGLTSARVPANSEILREVASGSIYANTASLNGVSPVLSFTTKNIKQALDSVGLGSSGCITSDGTHPGVTLYFALKDCAGFKAGSVHLKYVIPKGIFVPRQLTCEHKQDAQISYDLFTAYDGTNAPIVKTANVAVPALVNADVRYTMVQAFTVGGVSVTGKKSITIDFNPQTKQDGADSDLYPSVTSLESLLQTVTVSGVELSWFTAVAPITGNVIQDTNSNIWFQQRNALSTDLVHIKLGVSGLITWDEIVGGTPDSAGTNSFQIQCHKSTAGNDPIVIVSTAIALP